MRKAPGHCRSVLGVPRARVPLPLARRWSLLVVFPFPPVRPSSSVASVLCCLPGVRPSLLAASEFAQDSNPVHTYALRCLILLTALRAFPIHPARRIHSCTDEKTSSGLPFLGPLSSSATCRTSVFDTESPGFCLHHPPVFDYRCTCCHGVRGDDTSSPACSSFLLPSSSLL